MVGNGDDNYDDDKEQEDVDDDGDGAEDDCYVKNDDQMDMCVVGKDQYLFISISVCVI